MAGDDVVEGAKSPSARNASGDRGGWLAWRAELHRRAAAIRDGCIREPVRFLAYALIATSFVFMAFPWIDLAVSGWFTSADGDFLHARDPMLIAIRDVNRLVPHVLLPTMAVILLAHAFSARLTWLVRPHQALFVLGVYALGSGLVVNFLKEVVGRARPEQTIPFGGTAPYTIPWQFTDACMRNCSFSSGEAGSAAAMLSCVILAPGSIRRPLFWSLVPVAIVFSLLRVAFGRHFISDVFVSWLLVAIVAVVLWRWLERRADTIDQRFIGSLLPLGTAISGRVRKAIGTFSK